MRSRLTALIPSWSQSLPALLLGFFFLVLATLLLTDRVMPALSSSCGRLVQVPFGNESLSMNHARLDLPAGKTWRDIHLSYRLEPNEALSLVVQRHGSTLAALRISRHRYIDEGFAIYRDGVLERLRRLPQGRAEGQIEIHRSADTVRVIRDGTLWVTLDGADVPDGSAFEVSLHPPSSVELYDRVRLGTVLLDDGQPLAPQLLSRVQSSSLLMVALMTLVLVAFRQPLSRLPARLFPYQARERPRDLVWFLVCVDALFVAVLGIPAVEHIPAFDGRMRILFMAVVILAALASLAFGKLRDVLLTRSASARQSWLLHRVLIPLSFVLYTVNWVVVFVYTYSWLIIMRPRLDLDATKAAAATPRVVCVGGSVTRGFPFHENGPTPAFPDLLETRLRVMGLSHAAVVNLGVDAAGVTYIADHLAANLERWRPTHLVVTAVANDFSRNADSYRADMERVLSTAKSYGVEHVLLVKEMEMPAVHDGSPVHSDLYAVLDSLAATYGVVVVDPQPDFAAHRDEFLFMDWVHFTPRGNALMADVLARYFTTPSSAATE